ncbi:hypothetical protein HKD37_08G022670 [Glycine soja]
MGHKQLISHLQFVDDTLFILGEKSWSNISAIKATFQLFEVFSGLKVYFQKRLLVGINIQEDWLMEAAFVVNCKVGKLPMIYLGLSIGADRRKLSRDPDSKSLYT